MGTHKATRKREKKMTTLGSNNFSGYDYGQYYNQGNHDWSNPDPMIGRGYMSDYISRANDYTPPEDWVSPNKQENDEYVKRIHQEWARLNLKTGNDNSPNYGGGQGGSGPAIIPGQKNESPRDTSQYSQEDYHPAPPNPPHPNQNTTFFDDVTVPAHKLAPFDYRLLNDNTEMRNNIKHIRTDLNIIAISVFALFLINAGALTYMLILGG